MSRDLHRSLREAWIVEAVRTPIGRYGGALAGVRPDDLAALVIRAVVDRSGIDPTLIEDVILGCANQAGEDNRDVARMALAARRTPGRGRRPDRQSAVRLGSSGDQLGGPRDRRRRRRRVHRRRRRIDDAGPVRAWPSPRVPTTGAIASSRTRPSAGGSSTRSWPRSTTRIRWARPRRTSSIAGRSAASGRTRSRWRASRRPWPRSSAAPSTARSCPFRSPRRRASRRSSRGMSTRGRIHRWKRWPGSDPRSVKAAP